MSNKNVLVILKENDHLWSFFYIIYTFLFGCLVIFLYKLCLFVWIQYTYLAIMVFVLDPSSSVIKRFKVNLLHDIYG